MNTLSAWLAAKRKKNEQRLAELIRNDFDIEVINDKVCLTHNGIAVKAMPDNATAAAIVTILKEARETAVSGRIYDR